MKYFATLWLIFLASCGSDRNEVMGNLLKEQQVLKDSAFNVNARIDSYTQKGVNDSAETGQKQLAAIIGRLIAIQSSLDSLNRPKQ